MSVRCSKCENSLVLVRHAMEKIQKLRRSRGATLMLVGVVVLVIIVVGVAFFWFSQIFGGGRELSHANDAGVMSVARAALRNPNKDALQFDNPDVGTNFALLGENPRSLNLMIYNRLFAQALIVALNARDEGTADAANNAKRVWTALNDVGSFLRKDLQDAAFMGQYFQTIVDKNNVKMLGNKGIGLSEHAVSFLKRGGSTNVHVDPTILATFKATPGIPINSSGNASPSGHKYLAGYNPFSVRLANGETLFFSGVPVQPNDRPHLVELTQFNWNAKDDFIAGSGSTPYPANALPPNAFKDVANSRVSKVESMLASTACAVVGCLNSEFEMAVPYGYVEIRNGASMSGPKGGLAFQDKDIFCHALAGQGISVTPGGEWFCRGSDTQITDVKNLDTSFNKLPDLQAELNDLARRITGSGSDTGAQTQIDIAAELFDLKAKITSATDLIDRWAMVNSKSQLTRDYLWLNNIPDRAISIRYIRKSDGSTLTEEELKNINKFAIYRCHWKDYVDGMSELRPSKVFPCLEKLPDFKRGYNEYGSSRGADSGSGYTALEQFKCDVMSARVGCVNYASVAAPSSTSGVKWFKHGKEYPAPKLPYNFGEVKTPYDYMEMVDQAPKANGCAMGSVFSALLARCQQISPKVTRDDLTRALKENPLPLGTSLYLCVENGRLSMKKEKPVSLVSGTKADGAIPTGSNACGTSYSVMGKLVATASGQKSDWPYGSNSKFEGATIDFDEDTDGMFPGWSWKTMPSGECKDESLWIPSSGYNNLLGVLEFRNSCSGGGTFAQPN